AHDPPDDALSGGGRAALQPHRHAEGGAHRRPRYDTQPARQVLRAAASSHHAGRAAREALRCARGARRQLVHVAPAERAHAGARARRAARGGRRDRRPRRAAPGPRGGLPAPDGRRAVSGFRALLAKELLRFWKVSVQTIAAPVLTAVLYLVIFGHALEGRAQALPGVPYTSFLVPGLVMMSLLQNAFANSSSSLIQSKMSGNLVFILLAPISYA